MPPEAWRKKSRNCDPSMLSAQKTMFANAESHVLTKNEEGTAVKNARLVIQP
jgi:hypothetical protein